MTNDFRSYDHKQTVNNILKRKSLVITHYLLLITRNTNTQFHNNNTGMCTNHLMVDT